jgi:translation initiation factor 5B
MGIKIAAHNLDDAVAGSSLYVITPDEEIDELKEKVQEVVVTLNSKLDRHGVGVYVQASSLGSLEALLEFLYEECEIPVSGIRIGPVHKRDVMSAMVMIDRGKPEYACILAFDVEITPDAQHYADQVGVRIFSAEIIYHLEQMFTNYLDEIKGRRAEELVSQSIFPCVLSFLPDHIYRDKAPIVAGVKVEEGLVKLGTPLCIFKEGEILEIGKVTSIEREHKQQEEAHPGDEVCISIAQDKKKYQYGSHFDHQDRIFSHITRESLDAIKEGFVDYCSVPENFILLKKLKSMFGIM